MVNDHFLLDWKVVSKEANKMIMAGKRQKWQTKKQGVVAAEFEKEGVESEKTKNPP